MTCCGDLVGESFDGMKVENSGVILRDVLYFMCCILKAARSSKMETMGAFEMQERLVP